MKPQPEKIIPEEKAPEKKSLVKKVLSTADFAFVPTSLVRHYHQKHGPVPNKHLYPILFCELSRLGIYAATAWELKGYIFPNQ